MWKSADAENWRRWRASGWTVDRQAYVNQCQIVNDLIHQLNMDFYSRLEADNQTDPSKIVCYCR